jgi:hypothetical protein
MEAGDPHLATPGGADDELRVPHVSAQVTRGRVWCRGLEGGAGSGAGGKEGNFFYFVLFIYF